MNKIYFLFFIALMLSSCQSAKDALTLKKKPSGDEFLVEKKNPLVMPPNYGKLPIPEEKKGDENFIDPFFPSTTSLTSINWLSSKWLFSL